MGAWGTGLYSNDLACDIRSDYREMLVCHYTHEEAVQRILRDHQLSKDDPEDAAGWFALADCAWKYGHLDDELKAFVMSLIDRNTEEELWISPKNKEKRRAELLKLYMKIQNPPEKVSKPSMYFPSKCYWNDGSLYAIKMTEGQFANQYAVILIVNRLCYRLSRFASESDVFPGYEFAVTTYHSEKMPTMEDFQTTVQLYCNHEIDPCVRASYKGDLDKYTALLRITPYDLTKKNQKMVTKIGEIDSSLLIRIKSETMQSFFLNGSVFYRFGRNIYDNLYRQNSCISYEVKDN